MVLLVLPPPDHLWIGRKSRQFVPSRRRRLMTNVCASTSAKSRPELRIPTAAAQTRVVSGGEVWPIQRELSRHLKYMARARISEFESSQASQAVSSLWLRRSTCGACLGVARLTV